MSTKVRVVFASHSSTTSRSGFSKGNLGQNEGKFVSDKNQSFIISTPAVAIAQWKSCGVLIRGLPVGNHWTVIGFSLKVSLYDVLSTFTKISESSLVSPVKFPDLASKLSCTDYGVTYPDFVPLVKSARNCEFGLAKSRDYSGRNI